jgi:superfamily II DNA or RNA helicase
MQYQGKEVEVLSRRTLFGSATCTIRILSSGEVREVSESDLEETKVALSIAALRYHAIAARIKKEMSKQLMLAPYESNLLPLPHQILALEKVMSKPYVRYLLADEVGMGKTIETGLIIKELKLRGLVSRILIVVPKASILQWQEELKQHFNEKFYVYDAEMLNLFGKALGLNEDDIDFNPWKRHNQIIVSMDSIKPIENRRGWSKQRVEAYNKYRLESIVEADFDLLVIDECHKVGGNSAAVARFKLAETLCQAIPNVLLLSATPHRGRSDHFRRILQLLDAEAFVGEGMPQLQELMPYVVRTEKRHAINYEGKPLFAPRKTIKIEIHYNQTKHSRQKALYEAVTQYVIEGFNQALKEQNHSKMFMMTLLQRMASSSTRAVRKAMTHRLARLSGLSLEGEKANEVGIEEQELLEEDFEINVNRLPPPKINLAGLENETTTLQKLIALAQECEENESDAKVEQLIRSIKSILEETGDPHTKFLIFTEFNATQEMIREKLHKRGFKCAVINGSMRLESRIEALKAFKAEAQILISTDAAGESLNMQFCNVVFNYDLPWNPMAIEQRIGRVDRIGQNKTVYAFNLLLANSIDQRVHTVISEKLEKIMRELGIDKTADVLDSAIDSRSVNGLYLVSLLDPARFEQAGEEWLAEIKAKLTEYQTTNALLPCTDAGKLNENIDKTKEIQKSPLPNWLEHLTLAYLEAKGGYAKKIKGGYKFAFPDNTKLDATFDAAVALDNPLLEPLTLQHPRIASILAEAAPFTLSDPIAIIRLPGQLQGKSGYFSLWYLELKNEFETKQEYIPIFIDSSNYHNKDVAESIWNTLVEGKNPVIIAQEDPRQAPFIFEQQKAAAEKFIEGYYYLLQRQMLENLEQRKAKKEKAAQFQEKQLNRIGIEYIREYRKRKLAEEMKNWRANFINASKIIPRLDCLMLIRIER